MNDLKTILDALEGLKHFINSRGIVPHRVKGHTANAEQAITTLKAYMAGENDKDLIIQGHKCAIMEAACIIKSLSPIAYRDTIKKYEDIALATPPKERDKDINELVSMLEFYAECPLEDIYNNDLDFVKRVKPPKDNDNE